MIGGMNYCNIVIGAVLPWKERIFRLQLQFFSPCYVGINDCNVTSFLYRILSFQISEYVIISSPTVTKAGIA